MALISNSRVQVSVANLTRKLYNIPSVWNGSIRGYCDNVKEKDIVPTATQRVSSTVPRGKIGLTDHRVNRLEKYLLVWGGKYKTVAEVPNLISQDTLERARNKARIKINLMMVVATVIGCIVMVYYGKKDQSAGLSLVKINEDWHRKINQEAADAAEKIKQAKE